MSARTIYWVLLHWIAAALVGFALAVGAFALSGSPPEAARFVQTTVQSMTALGLWTLIALMFVFGTYGRHVVTWCVLTTASALVILISILGFLLPWGQLSFWLAARGVPLVAPQGMLLALVILVLGLHIRALFRASKDAPWHGRYRWWGVLILALLTVSGAVFQFLDFQEFAGVVRGLTPAPEAPQVGGFPPPLEATPLSVPAHIVPEWNALASYAVLRAVPSKEAGIAALLLYQVLWIVLPWLDRGRPEPFWRRRLWFTFAVGVAVSALIFGGARPAEGLDYALTQASTLIVFCLFLVVLPLATRSAK